jgi:hypothetical protein
MSELNKIHLNRDSGGRLWISWWRLRTRMGGRLPRREERISSELEMLVSGILAFSAWQWPSYSTVMRALAEARIKWAFKPPVRGEDPDSPTAASEDGIWLSDDTAAAWKGDDDQESEEETGSDATERDESDESDYIDPVGIIGPGQKQRPAAGFFNLLLDDDDANDEKEEDDEVITERSDFDADDNKHT